MKKLTLIIAILAVFAVERAVATNLRGQIVQNVAGNLKPQANMRVDLCTWNGATWVSYSYAVTGADGFYYFMNFPVGMRFVLLVAGRYYPTSPVTIGPPPAGGYQDLQAILI